LIIDRVAFALRKAARAHQVIDEKAVAAVGRDSPGRRVRLGEIAEVLEIGHDVAEAGRRELEAAAFRERAGADRLTAGDMLHDDLAQHLACAAVELVSGDVQALYHWLALWQSECQRPPI
jgi:hypothetical protein